MTLDLDELERLEREASATSYDWGRSAHEVFAAAVRKQMPALVARVRELEAAKLELTAIIDNGRAAHSEDRARADWLARDRDSVLAELRALRAVAEAASAFRRFHDGERPCGAALDGTLDAWRGLR